MKVKDDFLIYHSFIQSEVQGDLNLQYLDLLSNSILVSYTHNDNEMNRKQKRDYIRILRSNLPGRSSAGSSVSGRLVAIIIFTLCRVSKPSIWFSS